MAELRLTYRLKGTSSVARYPAAIMPQPPHYSQIGGDPIPSLRDVVIEGDNHLDLDTVRKLTATLDVEELAQQTAFASGPDEPVYTWQRVLTGAGEFFVDWGDGHPLFDSASPMVGRYLWMANHIIPTPVVTHSYVIVESEDGPKVRITTSPAFYDLLLQKTLNLDYGDLWQTNRDLAYLIATLGSRQAVWDQYSNWTWAIASYTLTTRILSLDTEEPLTDWSPPLGLTDSYTHSDLTPDVFGEHGAVLVQTRWQDDFGFYYIREDPVSVPEALELQARRVRVLVRPTGVMVARPGHILWQHQEDGEGLGRIWSGDPKTGQVEYSDDEGQTWIYMSNPFGGTPNVRVLDFQNLPHGGACVIGKVAPAQIYFSRTLDGATWEEPVLVCPYQNPSVIPCIAIHEASGYVTITVTDGQTFRFDSEALGEAGSWQSKAISS